MDSSKCGSGSGSGSASRTVCLTCGDEGDAKLLIYCFKCHDSAVHHYCLEKFSVDNDSIDWICWDCALTVAKVEGLRKSERITVQKFRAIDVRMEWGRKLNSCKLKAKRIDKAKHDAIGAVQSATTHSPFQCLQKERPSFHETKENKDIGERCGDVCYSEQQIESVKAGNTPLVGKRQEAYCLTLNKEEDGMVQSSQFRGDSSLRDPKSAQSPIEIGKQQDMRKRRRRFVVLDDDSDSEGEGGAVGGYFSSSISDEHYIPLDNSYNGPQLESANYLPAQPVIEPLWRGCFLFNRERETSINILAHISDKACENAAKAAKGLPMNLDVKILAKSDVWPKSFLRSPPTDNSIALYLFPELERDENCYDALLEEAIENDLAMSATIDDLEMLIFSSRELPQKDWRIRRKYYLWGVFRAKRHSRPNIPTLTANFIAQSSSTQNAAQSLMSPLSVLEGVNSREDLASPLSSCSNSISTKDSPDMLNAKKQAVEQQHDKCRIQTACDIYVSTQGEKLSLICNKGVMFITVQPSFV
ncbi:PHD finger-containing protein 1-like isoform X1 [Nicotiana tomentosiformis]|uniref:PHD finger-containing protein 1-like isoform X1 n=1 Tax=Nicotiana tomentosiformis TaxID=4098 RepID=UPI00051BCFD1|nr:uncharacterized protein LOC104093645 isoform X2 [Nicotiana tomentosiformis]